MSNEYGPFRDTIKITNLRTGKFEIADTPMVLGVIMADDNKDYGILDPTERSMNYIGFIGHQRFGQSNPICHVKQRDLSLNEVRHHGEYGIHIIATIEDMELDITAITDKTKLATDDIVNSYMREAIVKESKRNKSFIPYMCERMKDLLPPGLVSDDMLADFFRDVYGIDVKGEQ